MTSYAYEHNRRPVGREAFYAIACDPRRHVAVEACAGAGKTWMLVSRILRALLAGAEPQDILAITFTRKAAGEMRQRLQEWLDAWRGATDEKLAQELSARGLPDADAATVAALRALPDRLLATGRPVQIRTFHSWFAALLRGAPLAVLEELGLPAAYELLEDDSEAVARVWRRFHAAVERAPEARADFEASIARWGRFNVHKALEAALAKRVEFAVADAHGVVDVSVLPFGEVYPAFAMHPRPQDALQGDIARRRWLDRARALGAQKNVTPQRAAEAVVRAWEQADPGERFKVLRDAFFVAEEDRLPVHLQRYPAAQEAEAELQPLAAAVTQHDAWLHHHRIARLARILLAEFAALKRERGWVDMNDVERAAHRMLSDPVLAGWVQERLDQRIGHLLIDEFQDTNALQWQALHEWLQSYAGAGAGGPSLFIVGDPKQSIYRFRRAEPMVFKAAQDFIEHGLGGDRLSCDHTRRNAPAVIEAVNRVMERAQADHQYADFRTHTTESNDEAGVVVALPQIERPPKTQSAPAPVWRDSLTQPRELPEDRLVTLECRQAAAWIAHRLGAGDEPGHFMVLARRRERLAVMEEELRALHIPTQQPEKTDLCEAPEVQDVVALLDAIVSPDHDLSLARALRSPIFAWSDDDLVALASQVKAARDAGTPRSWLETLLRSTDALPLWLADTAKSLRDWERHLDRWPPHDALQSIFDEGDLPARFAEAAPPALREATLANLRALLGAALQVAGGRYLTPYAFVRALKAGGIAGPAVSAPGVVRLLTVHKAKGLEARVVILLDTDSAPARSETMSTLCDWPGEAPTPVRFTFLASEKMPPACNSDALQAELDARGREELNALYVAITRTERQLVLSSVAPASVQPQPSWWDRLWPHAALLPVPEPARAGDVERTGRFTLRALPPAPAEGAKAVRARLAAVAGNDRTRFGELVHLLLETWHLHPEEGPAEPATRRLAREFDLTPAVAQQALAAARRIREGEGAWCWDAAVIDWSGNEVELHHDRELLRIDRLVRRRDTGDWWVMDFKSAWQPEDDATLQAQMARYRAAISATHPEARVRAAFLTGQGRLVELA